MAFLNGYKMENSGKDPIADNVLAIGKKVTGNYADKTKYFDFSVTVNKPTGATGTPKYRVYVMDKTASGSKGVTTSANTSLAINNDASYGLYFELTSGTAATIKLKHDQWLSFVELPVGATYSVSETTVPTNYTASNKVTEGAVVTPNTGNIAKDKASSATITIAAKPNRADFENAFADSTVTPTGVIINNLPYIAILLLAVGAFAAFVVTKSRRREDN